MQFISTTKIQFLFFSLFYIVLGKIYLLDSPPAVDLDYYAWYNNAQIYAKGHFIEALNAYWSPLIIWLMTPLVKLNFLHNKEVIFINFIAGYFLLLITIKIAKQFLLVGSTKFIFILFLLLLSISIQSLSFEKADYLSAVCLLGYISFISDEKLKTNKYYFIQTSFVAILCVFGKSFYIYFIFIHLILFSLYQYFSISKGVLTIAFFNLIKTLSIVLVVLACWSTLLSLKYGEFTLSSAGTFNMQIMTPNGYDDLYGSKQGLIPPPNAYSYHHWVDPTYYPNAKNLELKSAAYYLAILKYNIGCIVLNLSYFSYFKIVVFIFIFFAFKIKNTLAKERIIAYYFSALLVLGGYSLLIIEVRYLFGVVFLLFIAVFCTTNEYLNQIKSKTFVKLIGCLLIVSSFMKFVLFSYDSKQNFDKKMSESTLAQELKISKLPFLKNKKLATSYGYGGLWLADFNGYEICSRTNSRNYGNVGKYHTEHEQYAGLKKHQIDYYLYFGCSKVNRQGKCESRKTPYYLEGKYPVYADSTIGIKIYKMKPYY